MAQRSDPQNTDEIDAIRIPPGILRARCYMARARRREAPTGSSRKDPTVPPGQATLPAAPAVFRPVGDGGTASAPSPVSPGPAETVKACRRSPGAPRRSRRRHGPRRPGGSGPANHRLAAATLPAGSPAAGRRRGATGRWHGGCVPGQAGSGAAVSSAPALGSGSSRAGDRRRA